MTRTLASAALVATASLLAACGSKQAPPAAAAPPAAPRFTVYESMIGTLIPRSNLIWELSGNLYNDAGALDPKQLTDAQWTDLKDAAVAMSATAKSLSELQTIKAAPEGAKLLNEGTPGAPGPAEVQAQIDADPAGFKEHAVKLQVISDELVAAAGAHDAVKTDDISSRLTDVCGACHQKYWYPNQPQ
jgi:cytochrome c556